MLRLTWRSAAAPSRLLTEDEFIKEVGRMAERDFAGAPAGAAMVEALDDTQRVGWRSYYENAAGLLGLLRQLVAEGEMVAPRASLGAAASRKPGNSR